MDATRMNKSQTLLHDLVFEKQLVAPKRIEFLLRRPANYLSDVCRRERVDFLSLFNTILCDIESLWERDVARAARIACPILDLLVEGTRFVVVRVEPLDAQADAPLAATCDRVGALLRDLGALVETIGRIEADGVVDERDDVRLLELQSRTGQLVNQLHSIGSALRARRQEAAS